MRRLLRLVAFLGYFAVQVVRSNLRVAREVLLPRGPLQAAIVPVPIRATTDVEVSLLTGLLALTPGTLPLDVDRRRGVLLMHALRAPAAADVEQQVHELESRLLGVLR